MATTADKTEQDELADYDDPFDGLAAAGEVAGDVASKSDLTSVPIDELVTGRTLNFAIYDDHDVLLLAEGSTITSEAKERLKHRGLNTIRMAKADAARVTMQQVSFQSKPMNVLLDSELVKQLDTMLESGLARLQNDGPSLKSQMPLLGCRGYDPEQRVKLIEQHGKNEEALNNLVREVLNGQAADGNTIKQMAGGYLQQMVSDVDNTLTSAVSAFQDDELGSRSIKAGLLAMAIGAEMGLNAENTRNLGIAGLVHDWGMMRVPAKLRDAERRLNPVELLELKKHPIYSAEMLQKVSGIPSVIPIIVYQVHERINGSGYPRGRCGKSIHFLARIIHVADVYAALTARRPYRPALMPYSAMECLVRMAKCRSVDPDVVRALLNVQSLFPIGSLVSLSDGSVARVMRRNGTFYAEPVVQRLQDAEGNPLDPEAEENIIDIHEAELSIHEAVPTPGSGEIMLDEETLQQGVPAQTSADRTR